MEFCSFKNVCKMNLNVLFACFFLGKVWVEKGDAHIGIFFHHEDDVFGVHGCGNMTAGFLIGREDSNEGDTRQGPPDNHAVIIHVVISKAAKGVSECQGVMETPQGTSGLSPYEDRGLEIARNNTFGLFPSIIQCMVYPPDYNAMHFPIDEKAVFLGLPSADSKEKRDSKVKAYSTFKLSPMMADVKLSPTKVLLSRASTSKGSWMFGKCSKRQLDVFKKLVHFNVIFTPKLCSWDSEKCSTVVHFAFSTSMGPFRPLVMDFNQRIFSKGRLSLARFILIRKTVFKVMGSQPVPCPLLSQKVLVWTWICMAPCSMQSHEKKIAKGFAHFRINIQISHVLQVLDEDLSFVN